MPSGIDIGHNHFIRYFGWRPDRKLNPHYDHLPDVEKAGLIIDHVRPDNGKFCTGALNFDTMPLELVSDKRRWKVESWEPLTISPSVLCTACNDHGFIREGRWVPA